MTTTTENKVHDTRASADEIVSCIAPPALVEHSKAQLGRCTWGVRWRRGQLVRDRPHCAICPLAAYLLTKDPDSVIDGMGDSLILISARHLSHDIGKKVSVHTINGFTNFTDRVSSPTSNLTAQQCAEVEIGRLAATILDRILNV